MSEKFARVLIAKLNRRIRFAQSNHVKIALSEYRDAIIETMTDLGHDVS